MIFIQYVYDIWYLYKMYKTPDYRKNMSKWSIGVQSAFTFICYSSRGHIRAHLQTNNQSRTYMCIYTYLIYMYIYIYIYT